MGNEEKSRPGVFGEGSTGYTASKPWDGLTGSAKQTAQRRWLIDRGWTNYGGRNGTFFVDEDGPIFTITAAVHHELAGRPEPRSLPKPPEEPLPHLPAGIGGGEAGVDPWV